MRIQSKYSDYYDSSMALGTDPNVYFERSSTVYDVRGEVVSRCPIGLKNQLLDTFSCVLFFCGDLYPFIFINEYKPPQEDPFPVPLNTPATLLRKNYDLKKSLTFFSIKDYNQYLGDHKKFYKKYKKNLHSRGAYPFRTKYVRSSPMYTYPEDLEEIRKKAYSFQEPIVLLFEDSLGPNYSSYTMTNPILSKLNVLIHSDFYNPLEVYQRISQYLVSELKVDKKETVNLKDPDKIKKHGFDKHSFRKGSSY